MLHNDLQRFWAGRELTFFHIQVGVPNETSRLVPPVAEVLAENQVLSYSIYDTLGDYDLFLRCWVPRGTNTEVLADRLADISSLRVRHCRAIPVSRVIFHWPWMSPDYRNYRSPVLTDAPLDEEWLIRLNQTLSDSSGGLTDEEIEDAVSRNILASVGPDIVEHQSDIKFVMILSTVERGNVGNRERRMISDAMTEAFREVAAEDGAPRTIAQLSLYETRGNAYASFVVLGRLASGRFYEGLRTLYTTLSETGFRAFFEIRPFTYPTASPDFIDFRDAIPIEASEARSAGRGGTGDVRDLLDRLESATLEIKASYYVQVRNWLLDGELEASDSLFLSGIIREVVAFLNSPPGGVLLVGVLESDRLLEKVPDSAATAARAKLDLLPSIGDKVLTGLELDAAVKPIFLDHDRVERHLLDRIRSSIDAPSTAGLIQVGFHSVEGRTLSSIAVKALPGSGGFAYPKDDAGTLFVRDGASTQRLTGGEADEYRRRRDGDPQ